MGEFEDTLGRILGDPSAMARIARLAQSLGEAGPDTMPPPVPPPEPPPPAPPPGTGTVPSGPPPGTGTVPPGPPPGTGTVPPPELGTAPPIPPPGPGTVPNAPPGTGIPDLSGLAGWPDLSGLAGLSGLAESPLFRKLLPLLLEGRQNTEARRFLYALRPYLSQRRQDNVERALQLARLIRVGRRFLAGEGGKGVS